MRRKVRFDLALWFGVLGWAAVDAFGWLHGLGIVAAVYLLMPHMVKPSGGEG